MARKKSWNLDWLLKNDEARINAPDQAAALRDNQLRDLRKGLGNPKKQGLFDVYYALQPLGTWEGLLASVAVLKGEEDGWRHMRLSLLYRAWAVRIAVADHDKDGTNATGSLQLRDRIVECLVHAMATGDDQFAHWCGDRILHSLQMGDNAFVNGAGTPFEPFIIHLYGLWRNRTVNMGTLANGSLGPYQAILDGWDSEESYLRGVLGACDYHCQRCVTIAGSPEPGLTNVPYHIFPAEILAIRRVRREHHLPNPDINHKLLNSPAAHPPETPPAIDEILLNQIAARARKELPNIGIPW